MKRLRFGAGVVVVGALGLLFISNGSAGDAVRGDEPQAVESLLALFVDGNDEVYAGGGELLISLVDPGSGRVRTVSASDRGVDLGFMSGAAFRGGDVPGLAVWSEAAPLVLLNLEEVERGQFSLGAAQTIDERFGPRQVVFTADGRFFWIVSFDSSLRSSQARLIEVATGAVRVDAKIAEVERIVGLIDDSVAVIARGGAVMLVSLAGDPTTLAKPSDNAVFVGMAEGKVVWLSDGGEQMLVVDQNGGGLLGSFDSLPGSRWVTVNRIPVPSRSAAPSSLDAEGRFVVVGVSPVGGHPDRVDRVVIVSLETGQITRSEGLTGRLVTSYWSGAGEFVLVTQPEADATRFFTSILGEAVHEIDTAAAILAAS